MFLWTTLTNINLRIVVATCSHVPTIITVDATNVRHPWTNFVDGSSAHKTAMLATQKVRMQRLPMVLAFALNYFNAMARGAQFKAITITLATPAIIKSALCLVCQRSHQI